MMRTKILTAAILALSAAGVQAAKTAENTVG